MNVPVFRGMQCSGEATIACDVFWTTRIGRNLWVGVHFPGHFRLETKVLFPGFLAHPVVCFFMVGQ